MKRRYADFHIHPHLKSFNHLGYTEEPDIWKFYKEQNKPLKKLGFLLRGILSELMKNSQMNLDYCYAGKVRLIFPSLMAIERPYFDLLPQRPFRNLIRILLPRRLYSTLGAAATGFPEKKVKAIIDNNISYKVDGGINYFRPFIKELNYMIEQQDSRSDKYPNASFKIARNYSEYKENSKNEDCINAILSVEGMHNFGDYLRNSTLYKTYDQLDKSERDRLIVSMCQNVDYIKGIEYAPLFITYCHHFNNLLAGHSRSLSSRSFLGGIIPFPGFRHLFNQNPNLNEGFSTLGRHLAIKLLEKSEGKRRILIDTKHMSIKSRKEYYQLLKGKSVDENIPIISSHACISGLDKLEHAEKEIETSKLDKKSYFSKWRINLTNEDIQEIYASDGMIGLILHEGRMPGGDFKKKAKKIKCEIKKLEKKARKKINPDKPEIEIIIKKRLHLAKKELAYLYSQLFLSNVFHIIKLIKEECKANGWKILCLGSDYDGIVDPVDSFNDARSYPGFRKCLISYFNEAIKNGNNKRQIYYYHIESERDKGEIREIEGNELKELLFDASIEERMDDLFYNNLDRFLGKYFTDDYLLP